MDDEGLSITDVGQVGSQLEAVDDLSTNGWSSLDTERQDTSESSLEVLLGELVRWVRLKTWVGNPGDLWVGLEPLGEGEGVLDVTLDTEWEGLETDDEVEGTEWVEGGSEITENLNTDTDGEGDWAESLPELESVVTLSWLDELWEFGGVLAPVELSGINDDTGNGSAVTSNPLYQKLEDILHAIDLTGVIELTLVAD